MRRKSARAKSAGPPSVSGRRALPIVGALAAVGALAWWIARPPQRSAPAIVDPAAGLGTREAHDRGLALARSGDPLGALPYFRRVVALRPDSWNAHANLAGALGNAAQQARVHLGKTEIATRSSFERIALMRETLRETEAAERVVSDPGDRAAVLFERGRALQTWGFPSEALVFFRMAMTLAPQRSDIVESLQRAQRALLTGGQDPR